MIVYKLTNLLNGKVYVGQTVRTLEQRIDQHKRRSESVVSQAIKKYGWENFSAEILEECQTQEELDRREIFWIAKLDCIAPKGYNLNEGGSGGRTPTEETRKKASESQRKRYANPEAHRKLSIAQRKRFEDPAEHEKLSKAQKKYYQNPEARKKNSESKKNPSPEARANMSAAQKRRWADSKAREKKAEETRKYFAEHPEAREYLSKLNKGKKQLPEINAKRAATLKGHETSAETRAKISAAHKARWAKIKSDKLKEDFRDENF